MQNEVQIELGEGEEILAEGEKNNVMCACFITLFCAAILVFIYEIFTSSMFSMRVVSAFIIIFLPIIIKYLLNSFKYNQIYLTDKRIIITLKDKIECIPYQEIHSFIGNDTVYLESKRKFFFAFTSLTDIKNTLKDIYPNYKQPAFTIKETIWALLMILFIIVAKFFPKYFYKIQHTFSYPKQKSEQLIINKNTYMQYLQKTLKYNWTPPKLDKDARVVVEFEILSNGTIINEVVKETSGSRELDNSALFAIRKSNPLKSLPDDLKKEKEVKINFTFDYNIKQ